MSPRHPNPLWHSRLSSRTGHNSAPHLRYSIGEFHTSTKPKCRVCWDTLDEETAPMPCGHYWCGSCIAKAFARVKHESQWPVVCIGWTSCSIPFDTAKAFLEHKEIQRLVPLIEEFNAPALGRTYCSNVRCGIFIPRREAKDRIAHCQACQTDTCSDCKGPAHGADTCPLPDQSDQQLLILSHQNKWQRCTRCGQMYEKSAGCRRIQCLCGYKFCYRCAGPYFSCQCEDNYNQQLDTGSRDQITASEKETTSDQQDDFRREFTRFTTRRARARTGTEPQTPYTPGYRLEGIPGEDMMRMAVEKDQTERDQMERDQMERDQMERDQMERDQMERDQAERAHQLRQEQSRSKTRRLRRVLKQVCDRLCRL